MDYTLAATHWLRKDKDAVKLDQEILKSKIDEFIGAHNTCALAVADGDFVRCTPIEYNYYDGIFWLFSEGGLKFRALKNNKHVCLAIYDEYKGFGKLGGLQVTGMAECLEPWSDEYTEMVKKKGIPVEALKKLPEPMNLIKITPQVMDFLNSDLKDLNVSTRQQWSEDSF